MDAKNENLKFERFFKIIIYAGVVSTWGTFVLYRWKFEGDFSTSSEEWSNFGSFYGGFAGPTLSFLSILILLWTFRKQEVSLHSQQEETTFFKMMDLLLNTVNSIEIYSNTGNQTSHLRKGNGALNYILRELSVRLERAVPQDELNKDILIEKYNAIYLRYRSSLGIFYRISESILNYIDRAQFNDNIKKNYVNILKAQFSQSQLLLIYYYVIVNSNKNKFKELLEKFEFFEFLEFDEAGPSIVFKSEFDTKIYGNQREIS